jgi:nucleoid-associated protein YgaU
MAKKTDDFYNKDSQKASEKSSKKPVRYPTMFDYLRFGESYTSLLLGIIVVIIAGMLFVSYVKKHNTPEMTQDTSSISTIAQVTINPSVPLTVAPSVTVVPTSTIVPTATTVPTATPTVKPTSTPTPTVRPTNTPVPTKVIPTPTKTAPTPTKALAATATPTPTIAMKPTATPTPQVQVAQKISGKTYVTQKGDDLWHIAERAYGDGYKWVEIAKANNLTNPNVLYSNTKLTLPVITPTPQIAQEKSSTVPVVVEKNTIKGHTYTVAKGDDLWNIAVRAYGDGYQWVKIAQANNLTNPSKIFSGNVLTIP